MSTTISKTLTYYLIQPYLFKDKSIAPPPLMFSWEIYEFFRSSHWRCFMKKAVLKNFCNILKKIAGLNFIKKRLQHRCFLLNIAIFLRTPIVKNICQRQHLIFYNSYRTAVSSCFCIDAFF